MVSLSVSGRPSVTFQSLCFRPFLRHWLVCLFQGVPPSLSLCFRLFLRHWSVCFRLPLHLWLVCLFQAVPPSLASLSVLGCFSITGQSVCFRSSFHHQSVCLFQGVPPSLINLPVSDCSRVTGQFFCPGQPSQHCLLPLPVTTETVSYSLLGLERYQENHPIPNIIGPWRYQYPIPIPNTQKMFCDVII